MDSQVIMFLLNGLLTVVAFFGGMVIKELASNIKDLRLADEKLAERLSGYVPKDEFREFRMEQSKNFERMFDKLDELKEQVAKKVDRLEVVQR